MTDDWPPTFEEPRDPVRGCRHPRWKRKGDLCELCGRTVDAVATRRNRNNRSRGGKAELVIAKELGGRKVGPLGLPWDVEWAATRLQVKKLAKRPSRNSVAGLIEAIPFSADQLRGFVWIEAAGQGKRGIREASFSANEWAMWHGPVEADKFGLVSMPFDDFIAVHGGRDGTFELEPDPYQPEKAS